MLVKVDEGLTVEVYAVEPAALAKKTLGDLLREIGRWKGESGAELDALLTRYALGARGQAAIFRRRTGSTCVRRPETTFLRAQRTRSLP